MAVEILILSGTRQGERLQFDGDSFRVSDGGNSEICFDAQRDPGAKNRSILIRREDDGWHIRNEGAGPVWLNQQLLQAASPIRSSDVIRLSESGPDISFTILGRSAKPAPGATVLSIAPTGAVPSMGSSASLPATTSNAQATPVLLPAAPTAVAEPVSVARDQASFGRTSQGSGLYLPMIAAAFIGIMLIAIYFPSWSIRPNEQPPQAIEEDQNDKPFSNASATESTRLPPDLPASEPTAVGAPSAAREKPDGATETDAWAVVTERNRGAVLTLAIESPGGLLWSFGTCFAVRRDVVVTTASLAFELEKLRAQDQAWKGWAVGFEQKARAEVTSIRVHRGYVDALTAGKPHQFFDIALLTVAGDLTQVCEIANESEMASIQRQSRIACMGIAQALPKEGEQPEPIGRFDLLMPELTAGRLMDVGQLQGGSRSPKLLFLPNSFPPSLWGSPVFNESGKAVGVFTMVEQKNGNSNIAILVAPALDPVAEWLRNSSSEIWIPPPPIESTDSEKRK